jgi:hypothetical protein
LAGCRSVGRAIRRNEGFERGGQNLDLPPQDLDLEGEGGDLSP